MRLPKKKSDIDDSLEASTNQQSKVPRAIDVSIIDGAAVVNVFKPGAEKTFFGHAKQ